MAGSGTSMALLGIGRTPSYVGAGRDLERKGGACPPKSDGSGRNTGPHVSKRNVRLASSKVAGPFRVGAGGASTSDVGRSHNGQAPPPPSRTLSPNWTVAPSVVERHGLLRVERRPGSYPVLRLILRSRQSPAPSTAPDLLQIVTPVAILFLFLWMCLKKVVDRSPPPAPVLALLVERPCGAVRHGTNRPAPPSRTASAKLART